MQIAYIRFNNSIELDYDHSSVATKGTDRRVGIFSALNKQGHKINIYSPVKSTDTKIYKNNNLFGAVNTPFPNIKIMSNTSFPKTEDVLLIENGTTNTLFSYNDNGVTKSFIKRTFDIIDKWKGKIVYLQWDADLPFPFGESNANTSKGVSERNLTKMGNAISMFKGKTWRVVTTALNPEKLKIHYSDNRCKYNEYATDIIPIPLCYDPIIDIRFNPSQSPIYTTTYVGSESDSYRNNLLSKYINDKSTNLIGKWDLEKVKKYLPNVVYSGVFPGHSNVYKLYNTAYTTVQCGERCWSSFDHMTSRFFQALGGGCIPLLIDNYSDKFITVYLPDKKYQVESKDKHDKIIQEILSWTKEKRTEEISKILSHNRMWSELNWEKILL